MRERKRRAKRRGRISGSKGNRHCLNWGKVGLSKGRVEMQSPTTTTNTYLVKEQIPRGRDVGCFHDLKKETVARGQSEGRE